MYDNLLKVFLRVSEHPAHLRFIDGDFNMPNAMERTTETKIWSHRITSNRAKKVLLVHGVPELMHDDRSEIQKHDIEEWKYII